MTNTQAVQFVPYEMQALVYSVVESARTTGLTMDIGTLRSPERRADAMHREDLAVASLLGALSAAFAMQASVTQLSRFNRLNTWLKVGIATMIVGFFGLGVLFGVLIGGIR